MRIEITCVGELAYDDGYKALIDEYDEYKISGLIPMKSKYLHSPKAQDDYERLEKLGLLTIFRAVCGEKTVGIISIVDNQDPESLLNISFVESLYVLKEYRKTGAGIMLKRTAEQHATQRKSIGILMTAAPGSDFAKVLDGTEYVLQSLMYFRKL